MDWGHYAGQVLLREGAVKVKYLPILLSTSLLSIMMIFSIFQSKIYGENKNIIYPDTIIYMPVLAVLVALKLSQSVVPESLALENLKTDHDHEPGHHDHEPDHHDPDHPDHPYNSDHLEDTLPLIHIEIQK